ncbi:MAG TPA: alpha/beta fold hydrolase [Steroidobacteraceae bacterium]|nr:alpha/beta fold hydrolase [Steroidobacteraceae bacterium]
MAGQQRDAFFRCPSAPTAYLALCGVFALLGLDSAAASGDAAPPNTRRPLLVGSIDLTPCPDIAAYCGKLDRPLDPTGAIPGRISIHFEYYRHSGRGDAAGTLVATEGGPGYPATLSRDDYLALFEPLRRQRDVLLMDNRGTGQSGAIDCHELQSAERVTVQRVGACGTSLGDGAPLYSTAYAADDLAAILDALNIHRIDLYGDSYGTYFEQVFAVRHPNSLRSIVLDGAYPLNGPDYAWYPSYAPAMRYKFDIACRRFEPCAKLPGSSIEHMLPALQELRSRPFTARAPDSDGTQREFTADASQLAIVMYGSAPAFATVRELDAAARAFSTGDRAPLLRLMAETISAVDSRDPAADPTKWSAGLAAAVMCQDPPQIFDMRLDPSLRTADRDRAVADRRLTSPNTYAPFTIDEYRGMPLDYSFIDQCVEWPVAPTSHPASRVVAADALYPDVPALIISGEFDNLTTPADGAAVAAAFRHGTQIRIANSFHVNALPRARSACAAKIVRRFIEALEPGEAACAPKVPPLRLVPRFAVHAVELEPASSLAGNRASPAQLKWISAAVMTAGDVLARLGGNSTGRGVGLRGGTFRVANEGPLIHIALTEVRWTEDLAVSGKIEKPRGRTGEVRAPLHLAAADGLTGDIMVEWPEGIAGSGATIRGILGGAAVNARTSAP